MQHFIVNYKSYPEATGPEAEKLTGQIVEAVKNPAVQLTICPQTSDIFRLREKFPDLNIWAQHIDPVDPGKTTGWVSAEAIAEAGANGVLINHSEHALRLPVITENIALARENGMASCVAVASLEAARDIVILKPDFIAFEPPELIASGHSLMEVDPSEARAFIEEIRSMGFSGNTILGAGVSNAQDIRGALELGYTGVLLSSAITKSPKPRQAVSELLEGFPN
jgi:triosephosphate isomerase